MTSPQVTTPDSPSLSIAEDTALDVSVWRIRLFRLTKRIWRPAPTLTLSEQAALSRIHTLEALLEKAARTLDIAADRFEKAGLQKDAGATRAAAQSLREQG